MNDFSSQLCSTICSNVVINKFIVKFAAILESNSIHFINLLLQACKAITRRRSSKTKLVCATHCYITQIYP